MGLCCLNLASGWAGPSTASVPPPMLSCIVCMRGGRCGGMLGEQLSCSPCHLPFRMVWGFFGAPFCLVWRKPSLVWKGLPPSSSHPVQLALEWGFEPASPVSQGAACPCKAAEVLVGSRSERGPTAQHTGHRPSMWKPQLQAPDSVGHELECGSSTLQAGVLPAGAFVSLFLLVQKSPKTSASTCHRVGNSG